MRIGTTGVAGSKDRVVFELSDEAVTDTMAILAKRGTGKSNGAVVIAERMFHAGHQWVRGFAGNAIQVDSRPPAQETRENRPQTTPSVPRGGGTGPADPRLGGGAPAKILNVLAQFPDGCSKTKVSLMAGVPPKKSTLRNALSRLRGLEFVEDLPGDVLRATADGITAAGAPEPFPQGQELIDHWLATLGGAPQQVFAELVRVYPGRTDAATSTIRNAMSKLRGLDLAVGWQANPELFG